jgi:hypothetical protein
MNKYAYKYTYSYICIYDSLIIGKFESIVVRKNQMFYEVYCLPNNKDYVSQLRWD